MTTEPVTIAVATENGGFLITSDADRINWKIDKPFLKGESVNYAIHDGNGNFFASTLTEGVFASNDQGKTWKPSSRGLHVRKVWSLEGDRHESGVLYAGTQYGHLFKSTDSARSWEEMTDLYEAPGRKEWGIDWGFGTTGLTIHTIKSDPNRKGRIYIVPAGNGTYRTDDSGKTWELLKKGVSDSCPVASDYSPPGSSMTPEEVIRDHLDNVHKCTHKLAVSSSRPGVLYQQNHCGVLASEDYGKSWKDVSPDPGMRHGFSIVLTEGKVNSLFTVPAYQGKCNSHNSCIQGQIKVLRSMDGGKHWTTLTKGLPDSVHNCVLRDAMAKDRSDSPGIYFGTTTGELYGSTDNGEKWNLLASKLGRIQGVSVLAG